MKTALFITALALSTVTFAGVKVSKEAKKAAMEACKAEGVTKKDMKAWKSCVNGKLKPAAEAVK